MGLFDEIGLGTGGRSNTPQLSRTKKMEISDWLARRPGGNESEFLTDVQQHTGWNPESARQAFREIKRSGQISPTPKPTRLGQAAMARGFRLPGPLGMLQDVGEAAKPAAKFAKRIPEHAVEDVKAGIKNAPSYFSNIGKSVGKVATDSAEFAGNAAVTGTSLLSSGIVTLPGPNYAKRVKKKAAQVEERLHKDIGSVVDKAEHVSIGGFNLISPEEARFVKKSTRGYTEPELKKMPVDTLKGIGRSIITLPEQLRTGDIAPALGTTLMLAGPVKGGVKFISKMRAKPPVEIFAPFPGEKPTEALPDFKVESTLGSALKTMPGRKPRPAVEVVPEEMPAPAPSHVTVTQRGVPSGEVIKTALNYRGVPYRWGGTRPNGWDCSGFTQFIYRQHGVDIPRTAAAQWADRGSSHIAPQDLQPGDLLYFKNTGSRRGITHTGMYIGNNKFVHAANPRRGTIVSSLSDNYYASRLVGGKRWGGISGKASLGKAAKLPAMQDVGEFKGIQPPKVKIDLPEQYLDESMPSMVGYQRPDISALYQTYPNQGAAFKGISKQKGAGYQDFIARETPQGISVGHLDRTPEMQLREYPTRRSLMSGMADMSEMGYEAGAPTLLPQPKIVGKVGKKARGPEVSEGYYSGLPLPGRMERMLQEAKSWDEPLADYMSEQPRRIVTDQQVRKYRTKDGAEAGIALMYNEGYHGYTQPRMTPEGYWEVVHTSWSGNAEALDPHWGGAGAGEPVWTGRVTGSGAPSGMYAPTGPEPPTFRVDVNGQPLRVTRISDDPFDWRNNASPKLPTPAPGPGTPPPPPEVPLAPGQAGPGGAPSSPPTPPPPVRIGDYFHHAQGVNLLLNMGTQVRNVAANAAKGGLNLSDIFTTGVWDQALSALNRTPAKASPVDTYTYGRAYVKSMKPGFRDAWLILKTGSADLAEASKTGMYREIGGTNPVTRAIGGLGKAVGRTLGAEDIAFRRPATDAMQEVLIQRAAKARYPRDAAKQARLVEKLRDKPTKAIREGAETFGKQTVFIEELGDLGTMMEQLVNYEIPKTGFHPVRAVIPFFRVPLNLARQALFDYTPFAATKGMAELMLKDPHKAAQTFGRATTGTLGIIGIYKLMQKGQVTGDYPKGRGDRDDWKRRGIQPWSIKVGRYWLPYDWLGPMAFPFVEAAALKDVVEGKKEINHATVDGFKQVATFMRDNTFFRNIRDVMNVASEGPGRVVSNLMQQMTPLYSAGRMVNNFLNPVEKDPKGAVEQWKSNLPFLSNSVPNRTDIFGKEVISTRKGWRALVPVLPQKGKEADAVSEELARFGITPGFIGDSITVEDKKITLNRAQQREYQRMAGQILYDTLDELISDPEYIYAEPEVQAALITRKVSHARKEGREAYAETLGFVPLDEENKKIDWDTVGIPLPDKDAGLARDVAEIQRRREGKRIRAERRGDYSGGGSSPFSGIGR